MEDFNNVQFEIECLESDDATLASEHENERESFENTYYTLFSRAKKMLSDSPAGSIKTSSILSDTPVNKQKYKKSTTDMVANAQNNPLTFDTSLGLHGQSTANALQTNDTSYSLNLNNAELNLPKYDYRPLMALYVTGYVLETRF